MRDEITTRIEKQISGNWKATLTSNKSGAVIEERFFPTYVEAAEFSDMKREERRKNAVKQGTGTE